jgi:UDP-galactopyranose mutase
LVFCGSLDNYFNYEFGDLPYRTVRFEEIRDKEIQGNAVINYTDSSVGFTRIHEHKWFTPEKTFENSVAYKEYASETTSRKSPYYPIQNAQTQSVFKIYNQLAKKESDVTFIGRLAEYKYYDMHQVIASSIVKFKKFSILT